MPETCNHGVVDDSRAWLSATEVLRLYSSGQLAPSEYLEMLFERVEKDNQRERPINAFVEILYEEARKEARAADEFLLLRRHPLIGITFCAASL